LYIVFKFDDIQSTKLGDYEMTNARRAAHVAILFMDNCHPSTYYFLFVQNADLKQMYAQSDWFNQIKV